jgi:hypothetical protein
MEEKNDQYVFRVKWSEDDGEYAGLCDEFPSLSWLADTPVKALEGIRNLVSDVLLDLDRNDPTSAIRPTNLGFDDLHRLLRG